MSKYGSKPNRPGRRNHAKYVHSLAPLDGASVGVCPLGPGMHLGDERHYVLECPAVEGIRRRFSMLSVDSHRAMRLFMWHPDQKGVAACLLQFLDRID